MTARHWPRWSELEGLLRPRRVPLNPTERRLAGAASIPDLRLLARRRAPRAVFDYTDGAAGEEFSVRRSRQAYARVEFNPTVLRDVSDVDTSTTILGKPVAAPIAFAPRQLQLSLLQAGVVPGIVGWIPVAGARSS